MLSDENGDLPNLRRWLDGIAEHPLLPYFESRRPNRIPGVVYAWWRNPILVAVEEMLAILEATQPEGLGLKRREFRGYDGTGERAMERFANHRSELLIGSLLAEANIPFSFNTKAGPDLLVTDSVCTLAIEIGSRSPKVFLT
jgi:hypothetical protein